MSGLVEKLNEKTVYMISGISVIIGLVVILVTQPWTDALGLAESPTRIAVEYPVSIFIYLIPGILLALLFSKNQEWIAPPGKYSPDVKYEPFSTYTLIATAIAAAIYAVGGLPTGINIDLPALITAFTAVYFGPMVAFLAFFIGFFIRWAIGGAVWLPSPALVPAVAIIDAGVWAINSYLYWFVTRSNKFVKTDNMAVRYTLMIVMIIVMILVHLFGWLVVYALVMKPWEAYVAYVTVALSSWYPTTIVFVIIGVIIGQTLYDARTAMGKLAEE